MHIHLRKKHLQAWQTLVHVCQRWRSIVFGSSRRLNVGLICTAKTPARDTLGVWPDLSLFIQPYGDYRAESVDNLIAVLESAAIMRGKSNTWAPHVLIRKKVR
jgi:hypothetical protein